MEGIIREGSVVLMSCHHSFVAFHFLGVEGDGGLTELRAESCAEVPMV